MPARPDIALHAEAAALNARWRGASPEVVLDVVLNLYPGRVAVLSSFGAEAGAVLSVVARVAPATPVLFLDTRQHFAQTLQHRRVLAARLGLTDVRDLAPAASDPRDPKNDLWREDPDACCAIRKVEPLDAVRGEFDVLVTGRKRCHGGERRRLPLFEVVGGQLRLNLLVEADAKALAREAAAAGLPAHPLVQAGFGSIGCWPCTQPERDPGGGVRDGRWAGSAKTECGIHLPRPRVPAARVSGRG